MDGLDLDVVVTTGRWIDPVTLRSPANATICQRADHDQLLADVDLVEGHGGHGTTMRALAHGVPLLIVPSFGFSRPPAWADGYGEIGAGRGSGKTSVAVLRRAQAWPSR